MNREATVAVGLMVGLCGLSCTGGEASPSPKMETGTRPDCKQFQRVTVNLTPGSSLCKAVAAPPKVCVQPDGVIEWQIKNTCKDLQTKAKPAFEIALAGDYGWAFEGCVPRLEHVGKQPEGGPRPRGNRLLCGIPEDAPESVDPENLYKYSVQGAEIDTLDPDIEIHR
jgi:hypothetical protein